ncbi:NERD domain-containing protein [Blastococcus saxobsidens]|uniref:NERD domain-containing protein n=1 Tax=Blastococcus saxobsidens TaxID=138336 RepID=A0A6L9VYL8_9ACTN|nr:nuclease-related domain-containing protein [Blastococcus saxobsidens]NEK84270.1 NERD domain-containing protein [Blastococcus saxobsidens]
MTAVRRGRGATSAPPLQVVATAAAFVLQWANGAEGRRRTRQVLGRFERSGWRVTHGVALPGGATVDHLAVGPCGVYVLDSRAWPGAVTVDHKGATITPSGAPWAAWTARGHHRSLPAAAGVVARGLAAATGTRPRAARAVVVVWSPFPDGIAESGGVTYIAGERLAAWLSEQPRRLDHDQVAALTGAGLRAFVPDQRAVGTADHASLRS